MEDCRRARDPQPERDLLRRSSSARCWAAVALARVPGGRHRGTARRRSLTLAAATGLWTRVGDVRLGRRSVSTCRCSARCCRCGPRRRSGFPATLLLVPGGLAARGRHPPARGGGRRRHRRGHGVRRQRPPEGHARTLAAGRSGSWCWCVVAVVYAVTRWPRAHWAVVVASRRGPGRWLDSNPMLSGVGEMRSSPAARSAMRFRPLRGRARAVRGRHAGHHRDAGGQRRPDADRLPGDRAHRVAVARGRPGRELRGAVEPWRELPAARRRRPQDMPHGRDHGTRRHRGARRSLLARGERPRRGLPGLHPRDHRAVCEAADRRSPGTGLRSTSTRCATAAER